MFLSNPLNDNSSSFPLLLGFHVLGIMCGVGTAALMNLRLMGVGITGNSPASLWRDTRLLTMGGLTLAILSGLLLFSIDPEKYLTNEPFRIKMMLLVAALTFYYTLVRRAAVRDRPASIIAVVSLLLFALVPLGGILIGYK